MLVSVGCLGGGFRRSGRVLWWSSRSCLACWGGILLLFSFLCSRMVVVWFFFLEYLWYTEFGPCLALLCFVLCFLSLYYLGLAPSFHILYYIFSLKKKTSIIVLIWLFCSIFFPTPTKLIWFSAIEELWRWTKTQQPKNMNWERRWQRTPTRNSKSRKI